MSLAPVFNRTLHPKLETYFWIVFMYCYLIEPFYGAQSPAELIQYYEN